MTAHQSHIVKRQVVELVTSDPSLAEQLQQVCSSEIAQKLESQIAGEFDAISPNGFTQRYDRLEVDLGVLSSDNFVSEFLDRFPDAFRKVLIEEAEAEMQTITLEQPLPQRGSHFDLVRHFLETGLLPWWEERPTRATLHDALEVLLRNRAASLRTYLVKALERQTVLRRFVQEFREAQLAGAVGLIVPAYRKTIQAYQHQTAAWWPSVAARLSDTPRHVANRHWEAVMQHLPWSMRESKPVVDLLTESWKTAAELLNVPANEFLAAIEQQISAQRQASGSSPSDLDSVLDEVLVNLKKAQSTTSSQQPHPQASHHSDLQAVARRLARLLEYNLDDTDQQLWVQQVVLVLNKLLKETDLAALRPMVNEVLAAIKSTNNKIDKTSQSPAGRVFGTFVDISSDDWSFELDQLRGRLRQLPQAQSSDVDFDRTLQHLVRLQDTLLELTSAELQAIKMLAQFVEDHRQVQKSPEADAAEEYPLGPEPELGIPGLKEIFQSLRASQRNGKLNLAKALATAATVRVEEQRLHLSKSALLALILHNSELLSEYSEEIPEDVAPELRHELETITQQLSKHISVLVQSESISRFLRFTIEQSQQTETGQTAADGGYEQSPATAPNQDISGPSDEWQESQSTRSGAARKSSDHTRVKPEAGAASDNRAPAAQPELASNTDSPGDVEAALISDNPNLVQPLKNWLESAGKVGQQLQAQSKTTEHNAQATAWLTTFTSRLRLVQAWLVQIDPSAFLPENVPASEVSVWSNLERGWKQLQQHLHQAENLPPDATQRLQRWINDYKALSGQLVEQSATLQFGTKPGFSVKIRSQNSAPGSTQGGDSGQPAEDDQFIESRHPDAASEHHQPAELTGAKTDLQVTGSDLEAEQTDQAETTAEGNDAIAFRKDEPDTANQEADIDHDTQATSGPSQLETTISSSAVAGANEGQDPQPMRDSRVDKDVYSPLSAKELLQQTGLLQGQDSALDESAQQPPSVSDQANVPPPNTPQQLNEGSLLEEENANTNSQDNDQTSAQRGEHASRSGSDLARWHRIRSETLQLLRSVIPKVDIEELKESIPVLEMLVQGLKKFETQLLQADQPPKQPWKKQVQQLAVLLLPFQSGQVLDPESATPELTRAVQRLSSPLTALLEQFRELEAYKPQSPQKRQLASIRHKLFGVLRKLDNEVERLRKTVQRERDSKTLIDPFSDSEEIYVANAGLVLLHPFLPRLFGKLGLLEDDEFIDQKSREKAIYLLQQLVGISAEDVGEFQLPLNKLMCGLDLEDSIGEAPEFTQEERDQAEGLLLAVTMNVPLMKGLSAEGFQRAYLQREGMLTQLENGWKLNVSRQTYDVIIDKIPWSINTIKFPWTEKVLFVEW